MERSGQHRTVRAEDVAHMGITEVLRHAPYIYRQYRKLVAVIQRQRPDIAVLIDFPDVNFRLAKHLARAGVPVVWFVSPQLWAWKRSRLRWVQERVDKMLVIFPFEERFYRDRGVDAEFVGHPLAVQPQTPPAHPLSQSNQIHIPSVEPGQPLRRDIQDIVEAAKHPGHAPQKAVVSIADAWLVEAAKRHGLHIDGYHHIIDGSAVRHILNRHGDPLVEAARGQLPISDADFFRIPEIVHRPDQVVLGTRTKLKRDQIVYLKRLEDGTTLYLEEIRTGKKVLAAVSMRRYPAAKDFDAIIDTLPSNAQGDGGTTLSVIRPPDTGKSDGDLSSSTLAPQPGTTREQYAAQHHLDPNRTWIALLPGSRWKEIRSNLPALHELAVSDLFAGSAAYTTFDGATTTAPRDPAAYTRFEFLLPVASTIDRSHLEEFLGKLDAESLRYFVEDEEGEKLFVAPAANRPVRWPLFDAHAPLPRLTLVPDAREALAQARASVVASGTATVLAAVVGNPFVVVYRVSPLTFALAKKLVKYPEEFPRMLDADGNLPVAMVNLIAGRRIVPELLQQRFTAANVANALGPLLAEGDARQAQIAALAQVRERLLATASTSASPIDHVAEAVLALLAERAAT